MYLFLSMGNEKANANPKSSSNILYRRWLSRSTRTGTILTVTNSILYTEPLYDQFCKLYCLHTEYHLILKGLELIHFALDCRIYRGYGIPDTWMYYATLILSNPERVISKVEVQPLNVETVHRGLLCPIRSNLCSVITD